MTSSALSALQPFLSGSVPLTDFVPLKIAVLNGGESSERAISLESGEAVLAALAARGHNVVSIDPQPETVLQTIDWSPFDAVFIALHGRFGEDGGVQRFLETVGIPFTGSGSHCSEIAFSKSESKKKFLQSGVPTLPFTLIQKSFSATQIERHADEIGFPLVVKPDHEGSSVGVSLVKSSAELLQAVDHCFQYDSVGLLEPCVTNATECTVSVFSLPGERNDIVFPPLRIEMHRPFFDYEAKYADDSTQFHFDFPQPTSVIETVKSIGQRACQSLQTTGIARADILIDDQQKPWVLEVNTIPGMTTHSQLPQAAAQAGVNFPQLCEAAVRSAMIAHRDNC